MKQLSGVHRALSESRDFVAKSGTRAIALTIKSKFRISEVVRGGMPNQDWSGAERRAHPRVAFQATARLFTESQIIGDFAVCDLSVGGALLYGSVPPPLGVVFGVWIASTQLGTIRVAAEIRRVQPMPNGSVAVGIAFRNPSSKIESMIQEVVLTELETASKEASQAVDSSSSF